MCLFLSSFVALLLSKTHTDNYYNMCPFRSLLIHIPAFSMTAAAASAEDDTRLFTASPVYYYLRALHLISLSVVESVFFGCIFCSKKLSVMRAKKR